MATVTYTAKRETFGLFFSKIMLILISLEGFSCRYVNIFIKSLFVYKYTCLVLALSKYLLATIRSTIMLYLITISSVLFLYMIMDTRYFVTKNIK